ncbi:unnamed protein product [Sphagnum troendelagicum]|uniref:Uncharacterized protein n=1 Tax=Sphagnum troendelagicum TaxID=128251 RepID=A0ABP0URY6_9BRYO
MYNIDLHDKNVIDDHNKQVAIFQGPKEGLQQKVDVWACSLIRQEMQVRRKNFLLGASSLLIERFGISSSRCLHICIWKNLSRNAEKFAEFLVDRMSATVIMD